MDRHEFERLQEQLERGIRRHIPQAHIAEQLHHRPAPLPAPRIRAFADVERLMETLAPVAQLAATLIAVEMAVDRAQLVLVPAPGGEIDIEREEYLNTFFGPVRQLLAALQNFVAEPSETAALPAERLSAAIAETHPTMGHGPLNLILAALTNLASDLSVTRLGTSLSRQRMWDVVGAAAVAAAVAAGDLFSYEAGHAAQLRTDHQYHGPMIAFLNRWYDTVRARLAIVDVGTMNVPSDAEQILAYAERRGFGRRRPSGDEARAFLRWWLRLPQTGFAESRRATKNEIFTRGSRKITLSARNYREDGPPLLLRGGPRSVTLPEAAMLLLQRAAAAARDRSMLATLEGTAERQTQATQRARARTDERARAQGWFETALKVQEYQDPATAAAFDQALETSALANAVLRDLVGNARSQAEQYAAGGATPPSRDDGLVSAAHPPRLPFFQLFDTTPARGRPKPINLTYRWVEGSGDAAVPVKLANAGRDRQLYVLMEPVQGLVSINPFTASAGPPDVFWSPSEAPVHGALFGTLHLTDLAGVEARLLFLVPQGDDADASALTLLRVWCRLLGGYGVRSFLWTNPLEDETARLLRLAETGRIDILDPRARGGVLVGCDFGNTKRLF